MKYYQYILEPLEYIPAHESFDAIKAVCKAANKRIVERGNHIWTDSDPLSRQSAVEGNAYDVYWGLSTFYQNLIKVSIKEGDV